MRQAIFTTKNGTQINCTMWDDVKQPIAIVQIIHDLDESVGQYNKFAKFLNRNGYIVMGNNYHDIDNTQTCNGADLFLTTVKNEIDFSRYIKEKYNAPLMLFGHGYGGLITKKIISESDLCACGVSISGTKKYQPVAIALGRLIAFAGARIFGPMAPARAMEFWFPMRCQNGAVRTTYFPYMFYYSLFKNLMRQNECTDVKMPLLVIGDKHDLINLNKQFSMKLYRMLMTRDADNLTLIIYPDARRNLSARTYNPQIWRDILKFLNSVAHKCPQRPTV